MVCGRLGTLMAACPICTHAENSAMKSLAIWATHTQELAALLRVSRPSLGLACHQCDTPAPHLSHTIQDI